MGCKLTRAQIDLIHKDELDRGGVWQPFMISKRCLKDWFPAFLDFTEREEAKDMIRAEFNARVNTKAWDETLFCKLTDAEFFKLPADQQVKYNESIDYTHNCDEIIYRDMEFRNFLIKNCEITKKKKKGATEQIGDEGRAI